MLFDFDGTVVDVWDRYHAAFCLASQAKWIALDEYREAKLRLEEDSLIANAFGIDLPRDYWARKAALLEDEALLAMDVLTLDASRLIEWFDSGQCLILTKRRNEKAFFWELDNLGIGQLASSSYVLNPDLRVSKRTWIETEIDRCGYCLKYVIGDTAEDMEIGELQGVKALFVRTGLKTENQVLAKVGEFESFQGLNAALDYIEGL